MLSFLPHLSGGGSNNFDAIRISLASPTKVLKWSHGEITRPDTINYRTGKPEHEGLFCARIFGPVRDYECWCGKYKRMKYRGIVCEKCGVEVTSSKVRRERMGHIKLAAPVVHTWFLRSLPSRISALLDVPYKDIERVLYFESYIVANSGTTPLKYGQILSEDEYQQALDSFGEDTFSAGMGAEIIQEMLKNLDLTEIQQALRAELVQTISEAKRKKVARRLKLVEDFIDSGNKPEWMVVEILPVIPPDLRPLVQLDGGRFATSDLNDLYRRVINRNNRLKRLIELRAPEIIVRNEKRMLQEAFDYLFDSSRRGRRPAVGRVHKSLSDKLKGKQGRFRQNLLGKRVDYSGRSVIVVGPELKLHQCGLPKVMALELFKPFVYSKLEHYGIASTLKSARRMVEMQHEKVWDILAEVIREHPVLLNRAPTLHRLGIQAFEPLLIEGKAIQLHPLVCAAFNADFDGDQMSVHVPLSLEAQLEARVLMMSTNNILSPANGRPVIVHSQDIILGLYYMTLELPNQKGEGKCFRGIDEVEHALNSGSLSLHAKIKCRCRRTDVDGNITYYITDTTPGRIIIYELLPAETNIGFDVVNKVLNKKEVSSLIELVYRTSGQKYTVIFADHIMQMGFRYACKSGISIGKDDIVIPPTKQFHVDETLAEVRHYEAQYNEGLITAGEKYNKVVDAWAHCTDKVARDTMTLLSGEEKSAEIGQDGINNIFMMADSGARGSQAQIKQLAGMRGLMTRPDGGIIETPIVANFKEGLSVWQYFISTHGARKGLADTAFKTANSGYLTRKLVDVAQDCIITYRDCGTDRGLVARPVIKNGAVTVPLAETILGRVSAIEVKHPITGEVLLNQGEMIEESKVELIEEAGLDSIKIRSALTCDNKHGVCAHCYGRDLATGLLVNIGEAVGIIAAQSIGEPGTQLTMRTFHIGGAVQDAAVQSSVIASYAGKLRFVHKNAVIDSKGRKVIMSRNCEVLIVDEHGYEKARYKVPYGARLLINDGEPVKPTDRIADWDPFTIPIISEKTGTAAFVDLMDGISVQERVDEVTGAVTQVVIDSKMHRGYADLRPRIVLLDDDGKPMLLGNGLEARHFLPVDAIIAIHDREKVHAGDVIARIPRGSSKYTDITGGLPRVIELFEARQPKEHSIIIEMDGFVEFGKDYKSKRRIIVRSAQDSEQFSEYFVPRGKHISVHEGDYVTRGDMLMEGNPSPHDILRIMGVEALAQYIVSEVQQVYRLQGVVLNDKHIEVIVKQMLQKVEVTSLGGTTFLLGEQVDREEFEAVNDKTAAMGYDAAGAMPVLQGVTKASLQTQSFFSAASFQETTRVLTEASIAGKVDNLNGLKENIIVGRLIPAGTGFYYKELKRLAQQQATEEAARQPAELLESSSSS